MNAKQRREIDQIRDEIEALKVRLETVRDEEQEKFDRLPEGFQAGTQGGKMEGDIEVLDEVIDALDDIGTTITASDLVP